MKRKFICILLFAVSLIPLVWQSCIDREFDEPPVRDEKIPFEPNASIADLKAKWVPGDAVVVADNLLVHAVVIANDSLGNFFRKIVVQDSTGGIEIQIDRDDDLHKLFPVGMKIGIKCQGLSIGDFAGLPQLGMGKEVSGAFTNVGRIPNAVLSNFIFAGSRGHHLSPKPKTVNTLQSADLSTLIRLDGMEFKRSELGKTFAANQQSTNLLLTDCNKNEITLRTSGFAAFASEKIPEKNGHIVGVFGKFNTTLQLAIRHTADIHFVNAPCTDGGGGGNATDVSIRAIRNLYKGNTTQVNENVRIQGIVTSDRFSRSVNEQNLFLQDDSAAIVVRFTGVHAFNLGDEVQLNAKGIELSEFRGLLQLNNVPISNATRIATAKSVVPQTITVKELLSQFENLEAQLIKIQCAELEKTSGSTYSGNVNVIEKGETIPLFTSTTATFANLNFPLGKIDLTALVSQFNSQQLIMRNESDVVVSKCSGGGSEPALVSIRDVRNRFAGTKLNLTENLKIRAIVTSDRLALNIHPQNIFVQDESAAIMVRFQPSPAHAFDLGDEIEVVIKDQELSEFNNLLQLNNIPLSNASLLSKSNSVQAKQKTIQDILSQFNELEGQLVSILNVNLSKPSGLTYSGTVTISDGTGVMDLFTRSQAIFSGNAFPAFANSITGHVSEFNTSKQIVLRNLSDVK